MEKAYADKKGRAVFQCPYCGFKTDFDASGYRDRDSRVRIKCRCGQSVPLLVEFREYYRKPVFLAGWCHVQRTGAMLAIRVRDLSMSGIAFVVEESRDGDALLSVGDVVTVQFRLDKPPQNILERKAVIRNIRANGFGASFVKTEYDKELGFYLLG